MRSFQKYAPPAQIATRASAAALSSNQINIASCKPGGLLLGCFDVQMGRLAHVRSFRRYARPLVKNPVGFVWVSPGYPSGYLLQTRRNTGFPHSNHYLLQPCVKNAVGFENYPSGFHECARGQSSALIHASSRFKYPIKNPAKTQPVCPGIAAGSIRVFAEIRARTRGKAPNPITNPNPIS